MRNAHKAVTETESLKEGYKTDERVYDTNADKTTYELLIPIQKSPTEIRLQHVLFMRDLKTGRSFGLMKHHAEDWHFEAAHRFDFVGPGEWKSVPVAGGQWVRKTTNLDDGLRYQCAASWDQGKANPEFTCSNFAPIPGRETRDMARRDYNTLERQNNVKTIFADGQRTPLARELGRTWYVRQPDAACAEAQRYAQARLPYWKALMEVWEEVLGQAADYREIPTRDGRPRYAAMLEIEEEFAQRLASDASVLPLVKERIRNVIESYRVNAAF